MIEENCMKLLRLALSTLQMSTEWGIKIFRLWICRLVLFFFSSDLTSAVFKICRNRICNRCFEFIVTVFYIHKPVRSSQKCGISTQAILNNRCFKFSYRFARTQWIIPLGLRLFWNWIIIKSHQIRLEEAEKTRPIIWRTNLINIHVQKMFNKLLTIKSGFRILRVTAGLWEQARQLKFLRWTQVRSCNTKPQICQLLKLNPFGELQPMKRAGDVTMST